MDLTNLAITIVKIVALIAYIYGLLWVLGRKQVWQKILGVLAAFGVVQLALALQFGEDFHILSAFDQGLLYQSCTLAMVSIGLNLIYGLNGQFSLAQWGFYGIGAYCSADITYRWTMGDASGLIVVGIGTILAAFALFGVNRFLKRRRDIPVLSAFTYYLIAVIAAGFLAVMVGKVLGPMVSPLLGTFDAPGPLASPVVQQIVFVLSIIFAGIFTAEVSFLFGLPVLTLGSDYFGIATLGFSIVVNTLMVNSDTILPFPEMKGGRGMIGIPRITSWAVAFFFLLAVIVIIRNLLRSSTGRTVLSVREDEVAAKAMGVDVAGTKLLAFVVGSLFAGLAGGVYAHYIGFLSPGTFGFLQGFNPLIVVVFGGLGSITGTIAAAFGWIFFLEGLLRVLLSQLGTEGPTWRYVVYPIALLLVMLVKPQGLLGALEWGILKADPTAPRRVTPAPEADNEKPATGGPEARA
jgi:branched-chain amino acid transport system permease protein